MIIDTLANADKYVALHPLFAKAFEYIRSQDLASLEIGKFEIAEGLKSIVSVGPGKTAAVAVEKFECHNDNIDIQVCISGTETIGWKPRENCNSPKGEYNSEKDVLFYSDVPQMHFQLTDGQFVIFFPEDVHAPMIGEGEIKKLVMKVKK